MPWGLIPQENDPVGPNGQGRGSWILAVLGSNPAPPLGPNWDQSAQTCCEADFGSRIKISGCPLGRSAWFFETYLFRAVLGSPDGREASTPWPPIPSAIRDGRNDHAGAEANPAESIPHRPLSRIRRCDDVFSDPRRLMLPSPRLEGGGGREYRLPASRPTRSDY